MADARWGRKHVCLECQAAFYDMRRNPIACPKCGVVHKPVAVLKSDGRPPRRRHAPPATTAAPPAAAEGERPPTDETGDDEDAELTVEDDEVEPDDTEPDEVEPDEAEEAKG